MPRIIPLLAAVLMVTACAPRVSAQRSRPDPLAALGFVAGQAYPDIALPDAVTGKPVSLASFRGKKLLVLHFASW